VHRALSAAPGGEHDGGGGRQHRHHQREGCDACGGLLAEGVNIADADVALTDEGRFLGLHRQGPGSRRRGRKALRIKERATDSGVARKRIKVLVNETDTDKSRALNRAQHEKERAAGAAVRATITTPDWRDSYGMLWRPIRSCS